MRLDAALTSPDLDWLTTRSEKVAYLQARTASASTEQRVNGVTEDASRLANQVPGTFPDRHRSERSRRPAVSRDGAVDG